MKKLIVGLALICSAGITAQNSSDLKASIIYGFKRSFFPGPYLEKRRYVRQIINYYDKIEKQFSKKS